jgi:hypothetical protein
MYGPPCLQMSLELMLVQLMNVVDDDYNIDNAHPFSYFCDFQRLAVCCLSLSLSRAPFAMHTSVQLAVLILCKSTL